MDNNVESLTNVPSKKSHKKVIIISIIIIFILLVLTVVGLFIYKENVLLDKKNVIRNSVIKVFDSLDNSIDNVNNNIMPFDLNEEAISIDSTIKLSSNYKDNDLDLSKLSDYDFKYKTSVDSKNNKMSGSLILNRNNNVLLSLNTFINGKHGLVESKELSYYAYNYNIGREIKDIKVNNNNSISNIKKILNRTKDFTVNKINENDITKDSVEDTISGNKAKYTRISYKVNINDYVNNVLKFYITDTSVLNTLAEIFNTNSLNMKNNIQSIIDNNKNNENIKFDIYLDSLFGSFKQLKIYNEQSPNIYFRIYQVNNGYEFEFIDDDLLINGKYGDNTLNIYSNNINLEFKKLNNNEYNVFGKYSYDNNYVSLANNIKTNIEDNKQNIILDTILNYSENDNVINFNINNEINISKISEIKPITSFITKDISTIDEEEENGILDRLNYILNRIISDMYPKYNEGNYINSIINI